MMELLYHTFSLTLIGVGLSFFLAGGIGMLRFPDVYSRLHATTKADNLGLGLVIIGLLFYAETSAVGIKLVAIWFLMAHSSATVCHLIARLALKSNIHYWRRT